MTSILVVDDSSMARSQLRVMLQKQGYQVIEASDGVEALAQLESSPDAAMIVIDVHMPNMNGLELLESLNAQGVIKPVIFVTAEADPKAIRRAKDLGARAWLVKPVRPDVLKAAIAKTLVALEASGPGHSLG